MRFHNFANRKIFSCEIIMCFVKMVSAERQKEILPFSRGSLVENGDKSPIYSWPLLFFDRFFAIVAKWRLATGEPLGSCSIIIINEQIYEWMLAQCVSVTLTHTTASRILYSLSFVSRQTAESKLSTRRVWVRSLYFRIKYERPTRIFSPVSSKLEKILIRACTLHSRQSDFLI